MKDIDFEELDRAVSSVLGTEVGQESPQPVNVSSVESPRPRSEVTAAPVENGVGSSTQKTLIQKRSAGRFMDVVHPSSDVRVQNKPSISRQATTVEPIPTSHVASEVTVGDQQDAMSAVQEPEEASDHVDTTTSTSETHKMPDPLEFKPGDTSNEAQADTLPEAGDVAAETTEETNNLQDTDALEQAASELAELGGIMPEGNNMPPLDTPFVNDSAIEKRPLGAFSVGVTDTSLLSDEAQTHLDEAAGKDVEDTPSVDEAMKEAIEAELVEGDESKESGAVVVREESHEEDTSDDMQLAPDAEAKVIPDELGSDVVAIESQEVEPVSVAAPIGAGSIPQQYTEKQTGQSEEVVPVFDTTSYHQPIEQAEKKKTGVLSVILIVVTILLIGAGVGAAVYYFDLLRFIS